MQRASGKVEIVDNEIKNMSSRGILALDNLETAEVYIQHNHIETDVYGSFMPYVDKSGYGIIAQSAYDKVSPGFYVEITNNTVKASKHLWCGISLVGPWQGPVGSKKLIGSIISDNIISLQDGQTGITVEMCDEADVSNNTISGNVYYGIRISSTPATGITDQGALKNVIRENHMSELYIKEPDEFSDSKMDGENFTGSFGKSRTAHIWLGRNSSDTIVEMMDDETYIDEGVDNVIEKKSE